MYIVCGYTYCYLVDAILCLARVPVLGVVSLPFLWSYGEHSVAFLKKPVVGVPKFHVLIIKLS